MQVNPEYNRHIASSSMRIRARAVHWIAGGLIVGAFINFVSQYILRGGDLWIVLAFSGGMLLLGALLLTVTRLKIAPGREAFLIGAILSLCVPVITLRFLYCAGVTVWAFPFIFIILVLVFTESVMFWVLNLSILATQIIMWVMQPRIELVISAADHMVRIAFFCISILAAYFVNKVYVERLNENSLHLRRIEEMAYRDHLTGLPNRLLFSNLIKQASSVSTLSGHRFAVLVLDMDGFKLINDTMGHDQGDLLLIKVSKRLQEMAGDSVTAARFGGDEFIILIDDIEAPDLLEHAIGRILICFAQPFILDNQECFITVSLGAAVYPVDGRTAELLTKNAEIAMYEAKKKGRNQYILCTADLKQKVEETVRTTRHLHRALERNEMELFYQPQVCLGTGRIVGLEALIRWRHPEWGMIPPGVFIPIAEQTSLICSIGEWVLWTACRQNKLWQDAGLPPVRIGVNLSVGQLRSPGIVALVETALKETGLNPGYLELEITESVAMKDTGTVDIINRLKQLGVHISIDDFGTEYSSLNYLRQLNVDRIKIAMPFIQGIESCNKDRAITKAIIVLAQSTGMGVIAEGVETRSQLEFLIRQSCDEVQGYYYHKPMPAEDAERVLGSA